MKKFLTLLSVVLSMIMCFSLFACGNCGNGNNNESSSSSSSSEEEIKGSEGLSFTQIGDFLVLEGIGNCKDEDITVPSVHNGHKVVEIMENAFKDCAQIKSITIPNSVIYVQAYAFSGCSELERVYISDGVQSIGYKVFDGCAKLAYNEYGGAQYLGNEANPYAVLVKATDASMTVCNVHENTKIIGMEAFSECSELTDVTLPDGLVNIMSNAFVYCSKLKYNTDGNGEYLGNENNKFVALVKKTDRDITSCSINQNTKIIAAGAFSSCGKLGSITIPEGVKTIGNMAFQGCELLKTVDVSGDINFLGDYAFDRCMSLTDVNFHGTLKVIGWQAFTSTAITSFVLNKNVYYIGGYSFGSQQISQTKIGLEDLFYEGTQEEYNQICIYNYFDYLTNATKYFYSESQPSGTGNFWHYDNNKPVKW